MDIMEQIAEHYGFSVLELRRLITEGYGPSLVAEYWNEEYPDGW
jgi:hypothetical protein